MKCTPHKKIPPSVLPGTSPIDRVILPLSLDALSGLDGQRGAGLAPSARSLSPAPPLARLPPEAFPCVLPPPAAAGGGGGGNGDILLFHSFIL